MRHFLFTTLFCLSSLLAMGQSSSQWYAEQWATVLTLCDSARLADAMTLSKRIESRAMEEGNHVQQLVSWKRQYDIQRSLNWDKTVGVLDGFLQREGEFVSSESQMAYHMTIADLLTSYYPRRSGALRVNYEQEPLDTWSKLEVNDAIQKHLESALKDSDEWAQASTKPYEELFDNEEEEHAKSTNLYFMALRYGLYNCGYKVSTNFRKSMEHTFVEASKGDARMHIVAQIKYAHYPNDEAKRAAWAQLEQEYMHIDAVMLLIAERMKVDMYKERETEEKHYFEAMRKECKEVMGRFPQSAFAKHIQNILDELQKPHLSIESPGQMYPKAEGEIELTHCNIGKVVIEAYESYDSIARGGYNGRYYQLDPKREIPAAGAKPVVRKVVRLANPLYKTLTTKVKLALPKVGDYLLIMRDEEDKRLTQTRVAVSQVGFAVKPTVRGPEVYAADFWSGVPYEQVKVQTWNSKHGENEAETIQGRGFSPFMLDRDNLSDHHKVRVWHGEDGWALPIQCNLKKNAPVSRSECAHVVTDRLHYRPKDTIQWRATLFERGANPKPMVGKQVQFALMRGDKVVVRSDEMLTDAWGCVSGAFAIPATGLLNGTYSIKCKDGIVVSGNQYVHIEEYAVPKFKVEIIPAEKLYLPGDHVELTGQVTTYGGQIAKGTKVQYEVRKGTTPWDDNELIAQVVCRANGQGQFKVGFKASGNTEDAPYVQYHVRAVATSAQGEVQEAVQYVAIKERQLYLRVENLPNIFERESAKQPIVNTYKKLSNELKQVTQGTYQIFAEGKKKAAAEGIFTLGKAMEIDWDALRSGRYELAVQADRAYDRRIEFTIYGKQDKNVPSDMPLFLHNISESVATGDDIKCNIGTAKKLVYAVVELYDERDRVLRKETMELKRGMQQLTLRYEKHFPDFMRLKVTTIYEGQLYQEDTVIKRAAKREKLTLNIETLRDKGRPGEQEQLTMLVQNEDGEPQRASIALTVYNKASDLNGKHTYAEIEAGARAWGKQALYCGSMFAKKYGYYIGEGGSESSEYLQVVEDEDVEIVGYGKAQNKSFAGAMPTNEGLREDFRLTAGWWPHVETDSKGRAVVNFDYPHSLATYRIVAQAVTQDMRSAVHEQEIAVSKEVMVESYMPQFVREGDEVVVRAVVSNLTDKSLEVEWTAEASEQVLEGNEKQVLKLGARTSKVMTLKIAISGKEKELALRLSALGSKHRDIEVTRTPVVPAVEVHRESAIYKGTEQANKAKLASFKKGIDQNEGTLQVRSWTSTEMLLRTWAASLSEDEESLPTLLNNWLAVGVGTRQARLNKKAIGQWAAHMDKDIEQKNGKEKGEYALPWEVKDESDYMEVLRAWANDSTWKEFRAYMPQIREFQQSDGGYAWRKGMPSTPRTTLMMMDAFAKLVSARVLGKTKNTRTSIHAGAAPRYVDEYMMKQWKDSLLGEELNELHLEYLRVRAAYLEKLPLQGEGKAMWDYYIHRVQKEWYGYSLSRKMTAAMILNQEGEDVSRLMKAIWESDPKADVRLLQLLRALPKRDLRLENKIAEELMLQRRCSTWSGRAQAADIVWTLYKHYNERKNYMGGDITWTEVVHTAERGLQEMQATGTGVALERKLYRIDGDKEVEISPETPLHVGDEVVARYRIQSDVRQEMVQLRVLRTGALRPLEQQSGYRGQYYREVKSSMTNYYLYMLDEGSTYIDERMVVEHEGRFNDGYMRVDCLIAPAYQGNTGSNWICVGTIARE